MRRSAWIDDFIEENDIIFYFVLMFDPEKREKQQNKKIKINSI